MTAHPIPSDFETRTNATYDALIWALSRPGLVRQLPMPGQANIVETLVDRECAVHTGDDMLADVARRTGATIVDPDAADHLFFGNAPTADLLGILRQGTDMYPEEGATLVLPCSIGQGPKLRLTGPGVDGSLEIKIGSIAPGFWEKRRAVMRYPMGFEIFLIDGAQVIGLPRSTEIEVL